MKNILSFLNKENKALLSTYNAGLLQGKAYRILNAQLTTTLEPFDISITEWKILGQLFDNQKLQLNEIAKILEVEPPLITKLIDRMEKKKFVHRVTDSGDKRVKTVSITQEGKALIPVIERKVKACLKTALDGISLNDLLVYAKVLKTIVANN
jgi:DNA-binding MarR family transcriptional regulator